MNAAAIQGFRMIASAMSTTVSDLRDRAHAQVAQYPQYARERFDAYVPVRVKRTIRTKAGVAFQKGDVVIANVATRETFGGRAYVTVWSYWTACDTSVRCADLEIL